MSKLQTLDDVIESGLICGARMWWVLYPYVGKSGYCSSREEALELARKEWPELLEDDASPAARGQSQDVPTTTPPAPAAELDREALVERMRDAMGIDPSKEELFVALSVAEREIRVDEQRRMFAILDDYANHPDSSQMWRDIAAAIKHEACAAERERCAQVLESRSRYVVQEAANALVDAAAAIRARETPKPGG